MFPVFIREYDDGDPEEKWRLTACQCENGECKQGLHEEMRRCGVSVIVVCQPAFIECNKK